MPESKNPVYFSAAGVRARFGGVSHMWILRRQADSGFPPCVYFARKRFWPVKALEKWEAEQADKPRPTPTGFAKTRAIRVRPQQCVRSSSSTTAI